MRQTGPPSLSASQYLHEGPGTAVIVDKRSMCGVHSAGPEEMPTHVDSGHETRVRRMIRVLLIVLAVVAIVLAVVLRQPLLFVVALGLLAGAVAILTSGLKKRHRSEGDVMRSPGGDGGQEDLASFGIVGIRPRESSAVVPRVEIEEAYDSDPEPGYLPGEPDEASRAAVSYSPGEYDPEPADGDTHAETPEPGTGIPRESAARPVAPGGAGPLFESASNGSSTPRGDSTTGTVRKRSRTARIMVEHVSDKYDEEVIQSVLRALRAALDATTVCLLKQEQSPLAYSVEGIVSRNAFARNGGRFIAREPLVAGRRALDPLVMSCSGPDGFEARRLGYYHEAIAIHQVAFVPLLGPSGREIFLLVADTMEMSGLETQRSQRMLADFGRLVQSFIGRPVTRAKVPSGEPIRSRRDIIAEEMRGARDQHKPLALVLVHLNRAEAVGQAGEAQVRDTEAELYGKLVEVAEGARIERFGELTFGVFRKEDADGVSQWASDLQLRMASEHGLLSGGISVGVAVLGDRHDSPDQLRSDATAALQESFETGECIILE